MQRTLIILACFYICENSFSQQYPFVHYTPKDGLISNQIRNIFQDSKGRLYFTSVNGLSVYDGSRFINYNSKNGLGFDIVNCVMEMGPDSIWVVTNSGNINCIVGGKMKLLSINVDHVINSLCLDEKGDLYASAEDGLLLFNNKDGFKKLPFVGLNGKDASSYIYYLCSTGNFLIVQRDASLISDFDNILYLYNKTEKRIVAELPGIYSVQKAPDGRIWASTETGIKALDTTGLKNGKFIVKELPEQFAQLKKKGRFIILFDQGNNCWMGDQSSFLLKATPDGSITTFTSASGLNMFYINSVLQDREGITWIATNNDGVSKLVHDNFLHIEKPFDLVQPSVISYNPESENLLVYSSSVATTAIIHHNKIKYYRFNNPKRLTGLIETPFGFFGTRYNVIDRLTLKNNIFYVQSSFADSTDNFYSNQVVDKNGYLITTGKYYITAIINGNTVFTIKIPSYADFPVLDSKGNIWVATRASDLLMYKTHSEDPVHYLEQIFYFKKELLGISPRSLVVDKNDDLWVGTRSHGIHVFSLKDGKLIKKLTLTTASGLSDDFTTHLSCDAENNIWASSALGLDKISIKEGDPVIENITRQNNIFQSVFNVVVDKEKVAWGIVSNGLIKITPEKRLTPDYQPTLMVSMLKAGKDTINTNRSLTYKQNNLSFSFAATSFFNEKQILYSYRLLGGSNDQWSEPSNISTVSFIDLPPGYYALEIKASYPAERYPEQFISYKFSIKPPWWQTWWFKSIAGFFVIGLLVISFRFYYRRKLEKQLAALEKQQAIEKERTRIATDMHDDLGAGLSRIKFLSETIGIKKQTQQPIEEDISKIREYSHEMIDKMGEIVWALNEKNDSLSDLLSYTRVYSVEYLSQNGIQCKVETPDNFPSLFVSGEFRRNVFLTLKEALHNIVKHSQANHVTIRIHINHQLTIIVQDDGIGFNADNVRPFSNGLTNMEKRMKEVGGTIKIKNEHGTMVLLTVPLPA